MFWVPLETPAWLHVPSQGFALPNADVDDVLRVAKEIENAQVYVDPAYPGCLDLSGRVIRLLQVALDVQFRENDELITDLNAVREEVQVRPKPLHQSEPWA